MSEYKRLTAEERFYIYTQRKAGVSLRCIASDLTRSPSTICRELKRNCGARGYRYKQAHGFAQEREKDKPKAVKLTPCAIAIIQQGLEAYWSPEQIKGRYELDGKRFVSTERIYQWILKDKETGGHYHTHLRHKQKRYRRRYGKKDRRGKIVGRVGIEHRPSVVDERSRIGDWEADTVVGKGGKSGFITLAERKSRVYFAYPIASKTSAESSAAITTLLDNYKEQVHTITYDNGKEFAEHQSTNDALQCRSYFANPYHSWERGLNENFNGLLRQFFPKGMLLDNVSIEQVNKAVLMLNNRPRKCLGYKTPLEVFSREVAKHQKE